jgi:hypothetical protein
VLKGDLSRKFFRAAAQRSDAVRLLMKEGLHFEAMYLAGYVIECSLKAIILRNSPIQNQARVAAEYFRGRQGHSFEALKELLRKRSIRLPSPLSEELRRTAWSTDLRYEIGRIDAAEAVAFVSLARQVLEWAEEML